MRRTKTVMAGVAGLSMVLFASGCMMAPELRCDGPAELATGDEPDFGPFEHVPRARLGALPYPGLLTLFDTADPADLGAHRYTGLLGSEVERGIIYTDRVGFIDIAHVRLAIDLTAYFAPRFEVALRESWCCLQLRSREPSRYRIELNYPAGWEALAPVERERIAHDLSIRLAQRLAVKAMTWHEIITWFGYKSTVVVSEKASAFSYDDAPSHLVGVLVAGEALRMTDTDFDDAVTEGLARFLADAGACDPDATLDAAEAVEDDWWRNGAPLRRFLEEGIDEPLAPWLVDDGADAEPMVLQVPPLGTHAGLDCTGMLTITIEPYILEASAIRRALPDHPERIDADLHFPMLFAHIERELAAE